MLTRCLRLCPGKSAILDARCIPLCLFAPEPGAAPAADRAPRGQWVPGPVEPPLPPGLEPSGPSRRPERRSTFPASTRPRGDAFQRAFSSSGPIPGSRHSRPCLFQRHNAWTKLGEGKSCMPLTPPPSGGHRTYVAGKHIARLPLTQRNIGAPYCGRRWTQARISSHHTVCPPSASLSSSSSVTQRPGNGLPPTRLASTTLPRRRPTHSRNVTHHPPSLRRSSGRSFPLRHLHWPVCDAPRMPRPELTGPAIPSRNAPNPTADQISGGVTGTRSFTRLPVRSGCCFLFPLRARLPALLVLSSLCASTGRIPPLFALFATRGGGARLAGLPSCSTNSSFCHIALDRRCRGWLMRKVKT